MCSQSIPFDEITEANLQEVFAPDEMRAACMVGAIRSRKFANSISTSPNGDMAALFSPATSARQLARIAKENVAVIALAACHPNGDEIKLSDIPVNHRQFVSDIRSRNPLPGRSSTGVPPSESSLVL